MGSPRKILLLTLMSSLAPMAASVDLADFVAGEWK